MPKFATEHDLKEHLDVVFCQEPLTEREGQPARYLRIKEAAREMMSRILVHCPGDDERFDIAQELILDGMRVAWEMIAQEE